MIPAYDKAMRDFLQVSLNGRPVPLVGPVPPHRAFARMRDVMTKEGQKVTDDRFIPLPFCSFYRMPPTQVQGRFRRADLRKAGYSDDMNNVEQGRMPLPYDIPYQVDIWCEYEDDFYTLIESYLRKWKGPLVYVPIDHGQPHGVFNIAVFYQGGLDNSDLETDPDKGDRTLRYTLNLNVEGFMSFPTRKVKTVRRNEILAAPVSTAADLSKEPEISEEVLLSEYQE